MNVVTTDYLTAMRDDLVGILEELGIPYLESEPRSLGEAPAAWFGRPTLSYDPFEKEVLAVWPLTLAGSPVDPETTTDYFLAQVWELWRALGLGPRHMLADRQRSVQVLRADPGQSIIGDANHPVYAFQVQTTVHTMFCS